MGYRNDTRRDEFMQINDLSIRAYGAELYRPWKLATFIFGMGFLFYGALNFDIPDWDVGISIIMGILTYVCAPWSVRTILHGVLHKPRLWPVRIVAALFVAWIAVDGVYVLYHTLVGNIMLRRDNFFISFPSYLILGFLWLYAGSLRELLANMTTILRRSTEDANNGQ
jgi:hypothetical protein